MEVVTAHQFMYFDQYIASATLIVAVTGVVTNSVNIKTFLSMGVKDGVTSSFLYLSVSDFGFTSASVVLGGSRLLGSLEYFHRMRFNINPHGLSNIAAHVAILCGILSILMTSYLAIVRCMCVAKPLHFKNTFTKNKTNVFAVCFTVFSLACYLPVLVKTNIVYGFDPTINASRLVLSVANDRQVVKNNVWVVTNMLLPVASQIVIISCLIILISSLKASRQFRLQATADHSSPHHPIDGEGKFPRKADHSSYDGDKKQAQEEKAKVSKRDAQVMQQVVIISAIYVTCNTPQIFVVMWGVVDTDFHMNSPQTYLYFLVTSIVTIFTTLNCSVNFFVYLKWNSGFRSHVLRRTQL